MNIMALQLLMLGCSLLISAAFSEGIIGNNFTFFQDEYNVKLEWAKVVRFNNKYIKQLEIASFKFNRTTPVLNLTYTSNWNMGKSMEVVFQAYKFLSNEYREFPLRFQMNYCTIFKNDIAGSRQACKCGNFTDCSMLKEKRVHICNYTPDASRFPPLVPNGRYKAEVQEMYQDEEVALAEVYFEIYRPFKG